ncbi:hypothetical protein E2C01_095632 [Portunus trituberculatus]|uniref:Uncharacterized protein n=1 Tax=Portunus trituberculatus TaxID=210409 RepID=A0A5B7JZW3_PORTR|nr:hypothetical protein [Portunus trituberculatus]
MGGRKRKHVGRMGWKIVRFADVASRRSHEMREPNYRTRPTQDVASDAVTRGVQSLGMVRVVRGGDR